MEQNNHPAPQFTGSFEQNFTLLDQMLRMEDSFDLVRRDLLFANRRACMYFVDGFAKDDTLLKIITSFSGAKEQDLDALPDIRGFANRYIPYVEVNVESDPRAVADQVLSGPIALLVEGYPEAILIDARTYPTRSLQEPDNDRVLRGARDGFGETLVVNTALIRRHIRDTRLTMEYHSVGSVSKTDVVVCYLKGRADPKTLSKLQEKLGSLRVNSLSMGQESLSEALLPSRWYNPFPKIRYTERPDAAAASVSEGGVVVIIDGSPSVMLLPTSFFDFFQDTNDYYFPPLVGSYLRLTRYLIYLLTMMLIPTWYLLVRNAHWLPHWLEFIVIEEMNKVPIFIQLMIVELIIDCLRQASLNTPASLGASFSVVSALILGDFAVSARWFVPEVLLYMAFVAVANFAQPSFELGYAFKLSRMLLIILIALFDLWGYLAGILIVFLLLLSTPTVTGRCYLYPLIPFDGEKMLRLFLRRRMNPENS